MSHEELHYAGVEANPRVMDRDRDEGTRNAVKINKIIDNIKEYHEKLTNKFFGSQGTD
jgi:hypothetical protein